MLLLPLLLWIQSIAATTPCPGVEPDYKLIATADTILINCETRYSVVLNGTSPGPPLYMKENQNTWVRVYNQIPDQNLTVHWHGLSQRTDPFSDGVPEVTQWPIAPGEFFDYVITPLTGDAGTYFYHSHVGFQAGTAHGVIIVEDTAEPPYEYDDDIPLLVNDYFAKNDSTIVAGLLTNPFKWSGEPYGILINGFSGNTSFSNATDPSCSPYVLNVLPDTTYRLRFIGATALSLVTLGIEDHDSLTIVEADGEYTKPWTTDHIQVASGQRFSVLLKTKTLAELEQSGQTSYWIRYENRDRPTNVTGYALLQYNIAGSSEPSDLPSTSPVILPQNVSDWAEYVLEALNPVESFPRLSEVTRTVYITVRQVMRAGTYINGTVNGTVEWAEDNLVWRDDQREANNSEPYLVQVYRTGQTPNYTAALENGGWDPYSDAFPALTGEVLDIVWLSNSGFSGGWDFHPMHVHGKHVFDLGSGNGTYEAAANEVKFDNYTPARRDTTILYRYASSGVPEYTAGWRAWRIRVTEDNVGAWMMHCHILQHMVMGMQTVWVFGNASSILAKFPEEPYVNGYLSYGGDAYGNSSYDPLVDLYGTG